MASHIVKLLATTARYGGSHAMRVPLTGAGRVPAMLPYRVTIAPCIPSASSRLMSTQAFDDAKERLGTLQEDPGNEVKLKMYALFKQSNSGKVSTKRPSMVDFIGRAKWDAWNGLGDMTQEEAQKAYIAIVDELVAEEAGVSDTSDEEQKYTTLKITVVDGLRTITLNRPNKMNAITPTMYNEWMAALDEAAADKKTSITAVTGAGKFFCSGNDLSNFANIPEEGPVKLASDSKKLLVKFVETFIDFPKPLVAVVNGPAIGVSVTTLALYDAVYASDEAYFTTPFTKLGQTAEGCSSYTFPRIMGPGMATEMLLFNKKISAAEAKDAGLVTEVIPASQLQEKIWPRLQELAKLPLGSLVYGKKLVRDLNREALKKANYEECERLEERWLSDDCRNAVMAFFARKN